MLTLIAFVVTLGVLITVHEYGHYQVARWCGVKVLRFCIGFGKPLFIRTYSQDQTEFVLARFPLGGYVKMLDEHEAPVSADDLPRAFNRQSVWKRIAIVSAGPIANLLLATVLYWLLFMHGVVSLKPLLGEVPQSTAAAQASMKAGELIRKVAGVSVSTWQDVRWTLLQQSLKTPRVEIEAVSGDDEVYLHQLQLGNIGKDDFDRDVLEKLGLTPYQPNVPAKIGEIIPGGAAERDGLKAGDQILEVNGIAVGQWEDFVGVVRNNPGKRLALQVLREGATLVLPVTPDGAKENGQQIGRVGAAYQMDQNEINKLVINVQYAPLPALTKAVEKTWETSIFSLKMLVVPCITTCEPMRVPLPMRTLAPMTEYGPTSASDASSAMGSMMAAGCIIRFFSECTSIRLPRLPRH